MSYYLARKDDNNFDLGSQTTDFKVILGIENRFFICESSQVPVCDFVVEFPQEHFDNLHLFLFSDGKKLRYDPSNGKIPTEIDEATGRYYLKFKPEQFVARLNLLRWIALNAYLADMHQTFELPDVEYEKYKKDIAAISSDVDMKQYIVDNLYYNL